MRLDFSQFHPLDHWPGTRRCRQLYGGWRNHLHLTWAFRRREQVAYPFVRVFRCPFGRHKFEVWTVRDLDGTRKVKPVCAYCPATRLPSERELDDSAERERWLKPPPT